MYSIKYAINVYVIDAIHKHHTVQKQFIFNNRGIITQNAQ